MAEIQSIINCLFVPSHNVVPFPEFDRGNIAFKSDCYIDEFQGKIK